MSVSLERSYYEARLSSAKESLRWAGKCADENGWLGEAIDCSELRVEIARLLHDSITRKAPRPMEGQLSIYDRKPQ